MLSLKKCVRHKVDELIMDPKNGVGLMSYARP